jgi:predicted MFS family arabinose efflux permease
LLAALSLASLACVAWLPRRRSGPPPGVGDAIRPSAANMPAMATALAAMALFAAGYVAAWYFLERIGNQSGLDHVFVLESLATGSLIGGLGGFLAVVLGRWMSVRRSFLLAIAATIAALLCLEFLPVNLALYFFLVVVFQLWVNVNFSNIMTFIAMRDATGRSVAMIPGLQSAGAMAGSIVAGLAFEGWGRTGVVAASITPLLLCAALMVIALRRPAGHYGMPPSR